jgi:hypothetical protein
MIKFYKVNLSSGWILGLDFNSIRSALLIDKTQSLAYLANGSIALYFSSIYWFIALAYSCLIAIYFLSSNIAYFYLSYYDFLSL